mgnify:CR=1 FL=1
MGFIVLIELIVLIEFRYNRLSFNHLTLNELCICPIYTQNCHLTVIWLSSSCYVENSFCHGILSA